MKSTISSKGQITVPVAIRQALGLRPGTVVSFEQRPEGALLRRARVTLHPVDEVFGALSVPAGVDGLIESLRGGRAGRAGRAAGRRRRTGR